MKPIHFQDLTLPKTPNYALAAYEGYEVNSNKGPVSPDKIDLQRAGFKVGVYPVSKVVLGARIAQALKTMPRLQCIKQDLEKGEFRFVQKTGLLGRLEKTVLGLPDWIDIQVVSNAKDTTSSFILLSRSQYGYSDLGLNKDRVQYCLDIINGVTPSVAFSPYLPFTATHHALAGFMLTTLIAAPLLALSGITGGVLFAMTLGAALLGAALTYYFIPAGPSPEPLIEKAMNPNTAYVPPIAPCLVTPDVPKHEEKPLLAETSPPLKARP